MTERQHQRHKPPVALDASRDLVIACAPLRSRVNLARIVRAAGCFGLKRVCAVGSVRLDRTIAREAADVVAVERHRSLIPLLKRLRGEGFDLVALEQASGSVSLYEASFSRQTCLVIGNERLGLAEEILALVDWVVEIPVYGRPHSHNAASAAIIAMSEYCRQFQKGRGMRAEG